MKKVIGILILCIGLIGFSNLAEAQRKAPPKKQAAAKSGLDQQVQYHKNVQKSNSQYQQLPKAPKTNNQYQSASEVKANAKPPAKNQYDAASSSLKNGSSQTNPYGPLPLKPKGAADNNITPPKRTAYGDTKLTDKPQPNNPYGPLPLKPKNAPDNNLNTGGPGIYAKPPPPQSGPVLKRTPAEKNLNEKAKNATNAADNGGYLKPPPPPKKDKNGDQ
ncbi:MAG: hypothetical protein AAF598_02890 [Bacteroidota bacterium]